MASKLVRESRFIKSDIANNNNKFWYIEQYNDNTVITKFGRVGDNAQSKEKQFSSEEEATKHYDKTIKTKTGPRKGYTELKVVIGAVPEVKKNGSLTDIALKQINTNNTETEKLIKYLSLKNIHNIVNSTTIKYNESNGTFSTPCGIITQEGIDLARGLLNVITPYVESKDFHNDEFVKSVQQYIQLIPRITSRKLVHEQIIPNVESIDKENQILDALTASLQQVISSAVPTKEEVEHPKLFSVTVDVVDDKSIIDHIIKFYNQTKNQKHTSSKLKVKTVYAIKIDHMYEAFENKGKKIGNIMELWHGTRVENVLSILKGGLIIPKSNAGHCTGRLFGDGVYFSDQSTKSLNYSQGYWGHGSTDNNCFMFLANVAMGKSYTPKYTEGHLLPKKGFDSTFAKANISGVKNNEMIVYNLYQCNLTYLIEFSER
jgi:poly [ADP-ribose] polymerase